MKSRQEPTFVKNQLDCHNDFAFKETTGRSEMEEFAESAIQLEADREAEYEILDVELSALARKVQQTWRTWTDAKTSGIAPFREIKPQKFNLFSELGDFDTPLNDEERQFILDLELKVL